ncbi:MAG: hypothetical protein FD167_97 [bacterium]|nr:MAG: hypothetical protein FD167_97 [bacterium]
MSKSYLLGIVAGTTLLMVGSVVGSNLQRATAAKPQQTLGTALQQMKLAEEEAIYSKEIRDATPVQLGRLTRTQQIHSKFYTHYKELRGKAISEIAAPFKGKNKVIETVVCLPLLEKLTEPETPEYYFGKLTNNSDAVIRGKVINVTSQLTEDDGFIFTDYNIAVAEVLKNNTTSPIKAGATVSVIRPGGKVVFDGVIVKAKDQMLAPLNMEKEVVLFLKFIPESGSYQSTDPSGTFELDGSSIRPLTDLAFPPGVLGDSDRNSFLQTFRNRSQEQ